MALVAGMTGLRCHQFAKAFPRIHMAAAKVDALLCPSIWLRNRRLILFPLLKHVVQFNYLLSRSLDNVCVCAIEFQLRSCLCANNLVEPTNLSACDLCSSSRLKYIIANFLIRFSLFISLQVSDLVLSSSSSYCVCRAGTCVATV